MNKSIVALLIAITFFSCDNDQIIKVSGELIGGSQDTLIFKQKNTGNEFKAPVNNIGVFLAEFKSKSGYYKVSSKSVFPEVDVFLDSKQEFVMNFEMKDWRRKRQYNVFNSPENDYINKFTSSRNNIRRKYNLKKLVPERFIFVIDSIFSAQNEYLKEFLKKNKKIDSEFIHIEQNRILYNWAFNKEDYALHNKTFTLPENYFDFRELLDYSDENLLTPILYYGIAVRRYITNETKRTLPEGEDWVLHQINTCIKNISNQKVLDMVLVNDVEISLEYSKKYEEAYELFIKHCKSDRFVKSATEKYKIYQSTKKGNPSPKFINYENFDGGTTSLDDFKGRYVYTDVWATWCGPCIKEIPALKEIEKKYKGKNIQFVSISIDEEKNKEAWKKMINDKQLKGIQLFADKDWNSKFLKDYNISAIPRFILIDTEGNIIDANAPRPSDPKLDTLLNSLK